MPFMLLVKKKKILEIGKKERRGTKRFREQRIRDMLKERCGEDFLRIVKKRYTSEKW